MNVVTPLRDPAKPSVVVRTKEASDRAPVREPLSRPGYFERLYVLLVFTMYTIDLPTSWFREVTAEGSRNASTGPLTSVVFAGLGGLAIVFLLPNLHLAQRLLARTLPLSLLMAWFMASALWSFDPPTTFRRGLSLVVAMVTALYLVIRFERREQVRLLGGSLFFSSLLQAAFIFGLPRFGQTSSGWSGIFQNKNQLGQIAVFAILIFAVVIWDRPRSIVWAGPMIGLNIAFLIGSKSKTSLASLALLAALIVVFQAFRARQTLYGAVVISMTVASVLGVMIGTAQLGLIADLLGKDITLTGRTQLWSDIVAQLGERPIAGYGYATFWNGYFSPSHELLLRHPWNPPSAHNAPLDYLLELGVVGLVLFVFYFVLSTARATREIRDVKGILGSLPLLLISYQLMFSVTESGVIARTIQWLVIMMAVFSLRSSTGAADENAAVKGTEATDPVAERRAGMPTSL